MIRDLQNELAQQTHVVDTKAKARDAASEVQQFEHEKARQNGIIKTQADELKRLKAELREPQPANDEAREQTEAMEASVQEAESKAMSLKQSLRTSEQQRRKLKAVSQEHTKANRSARKKWYRAKRQVETDRVTLQSERAALQGDRAALQGDGAALQNDTAVLQNERGVLQNERATLQNERVALQNERAAFERQTANINGQTGHIWDEVDRRQKEIGELNAKIADLEERNDNFATQNRHLAAQVTELQGQINVQLAKPEVTRVYVAGREMTTERLSKELEVLNSDLRKSEGWRKAQEKEGKRLQAFKAEIERVVTAVRQIPQESNLKVSKLASFMEKVRMSPLIE